MTRREIALQKVTKVKLSPGGINYALRPWEVSFKASMAEIGIFLSEGDSHFECDRLCGEDLAKEYMGPMARVAQKLEKLNTVPQHRICKCGFLVPINAACPNCDRVRHG